MDLTDRQWAVVEPLLPKPRVREDGRGRPWRDPRDVLDAILWVLRTGAPWKDLPERYPSYQTCHRRFQAWCENGVLGALLRAPRAGPGGPRRARPLGMLRRRLLRLGEKGGDGAGKTKRGKGTKIMAVADRAGLPVAAIATSASPGEVTLVEATLASRFVDAMPSRLVGDKAYDSDPLDERLRELGVETVSPHRRNRVKPATQEEGPLEAYKERWRVERLFAWLQNYRRVLVRHERRLANYLGFVQLGCALILMRRL